MSKTDSNDADNYQGGRLFGVNGPEPDGDISVEMFPDDVDPFELSEKRRRILKLAIIWPEATYNDLYEKYRSTYDDDISKGYLSQTVLDYLGSRAGASGISDDSFVCDECGEEFENAQGLGSHERIHDDTEYECPDCERSFSTRTALSNHTDASHPDTDDISIERGNKSFSGKPIDATMQSITERPELDEPTQDGEVPDDTEPLETVGRERPEPNYSGAERQPDDEPTPQYIQLEDDEVLDVLDALSNDFEGNRDLIEKVAKSFE